MSLEKFQATEIWRNKFKNHLLAERKPPAPVTSAAPVVRLPHRLSFELSEDLLVILEEKKIPEGRKMPRVRVGEDNKENCDRPQHERVHKTPTKFKRTYKYDATMLEDTSDVLQITNTSFSALEEMCEKTASDPDSTLFRYLHHDEPHESQETRSVRPPTHDEEADALQRLLDELNVEETEKRLAQPSPNDTQLDDIEAPSRFWENTMTPETLQSISPVKMVGLMRQSTIMEECSDVSETETSGTSYQSATKTGWTSETTGCYETANDTVSGSESGAAKKVSINSSAASSTSSDLFQQRTSRQRFFSETKEEVHEESVQLIDLDATAVVSSSPEGESSESPDTPDSPDSPQSSNSLPSSNLLHSSNSVVFSNSLDTRNSTNPIENNTRLSEESTNEPEDSLELEPLKSSMESAQETQTDVSSSVIDVSDDDSLGCKILEKIESQEADSVLNRSFTIERGNAEDEDKSLHFNDTMEEVEYMMKKGMQYMQAAKVESSSVKNNLTPVKNAERYRSPSPMLSSPRTPSTVIAKPKPVNKFAMDIKPFPKLDLFKKPQTTRLKAPTVENKFVASVKKTQYAHVYSPIRAYINKTATTPLIADIKSSCTGTSKAFKQLDTDSRMGPNTTPVQPPTKSVKMFPPCSLPKKAYISSDLKHIVDERTPVTIPGGQKIQRYLTNALLPAVVRHDGKVKLPADMRTSDMGPPQAPRPTDDSLADLSLASGDVSLYTIKDAQKF